METITLTYDEHNEVLRKLVEVFISLGVVVSIDNSKTDTSKEIQQLANNVKGVKQGKIVTRPVSRLLDEM